MAELEAELERAATYFLMTRSEFYNLEAPSASRRSSACASSATGSGSTPSTRRPRSTPASTRSRVAQPRPRVHDGRRSQGRVNAMQAGFFDPAQYRSDSNQHWRHGCPHEALAAGDFEWLQLLVHPEIWAYPGETMRETMLAMLDAERELRLEQLADDRSTSPERGPARRRRLRVARDGTRRRRRQRRRARGRPGRRHRPPPVGPRPRAHALLRHFERVGFDGAPRVLGFDEKGREVLSYVDGTAALAPLPRGDDVIEALGRLLRRMHDAQAGRPPPDWTRSRSSRHRRQPRCHTSSATTTSSRRM